MATNKNDEGSGIPQTSTMEQIKQGIKDISDLSLLQPVLARTRKRVKELTELGSARHTVIKQGLHKQIVTQPPQVHMNLPSATIENNIGYINYVVYKQDNKGNKAEKKHMVQMTNDKGETREFLGSINFVVEKEVLEIIEFRKPIQIKEYKVES
jgi:hypothetical protein